jgi:hypothetical protein
MNELLRIAKMYLSDLEHSSMQLSAVSTVQALTIEQSFKLNDINMKISWIKHELSMCPALDGKPYLWWEDYEK